MSTVANTNDQRDQHQREKRQAPVKRDHQSERRPGHERVVGDAEHRLRHNAFDVVDVVADARHHLARAMAGVEANRLVHQAVEELLAQVEDDALADALGQIVLSEPDQARRDRRADARAHQCKHVRKLRVLARQVVDQRCEHQRRRETQQRPDRDAPERKHGCSPVRAQVAEHAAHEAAIDPLLGLVAPVRRHRDAGAVLLHDLTRPAGETAPQARR